MTYIVNPKSKKEQKLLETLLTGLSIGFYTEENEDKALLKAMKSGRKTRLLTVKEKSSFLEKLRTAK